MAGHIEGKKLNMQALLDEHPQRKELAIYTVRKAEIGKLQGLDRLPLETLELRWLSASDLTDVPLPPGLKNLMVWHCSKLRSLDGLQAASQLKHLALEDNAPLEDASALAALKHLTSLSIQGGFGSNQKVKNLNAIAGLPIEQLTLRAIDGGELDLSPVAQLPKLRELDLHGPNFAPEELAKVAAAYPWFLEQLLDLEDYTLGGMRCKKCSGVQKQMFLRRKKFLWCPACNQAGIDRTIGGFLELVEQAKAT